MARGARRRNPGYSSRVTEPDVALTDYAIAVLCGVLTALVRRWPDVPAAVRRWWMVLFASIGVGAVAGGTVHGFFLDETSAGHRVLWPATLLALGVTATAMWFVGSFAGLRARSGRVVRQAAIAALVAYTVVVLFFDQRFVVAIGAYLPATVFLLVVLVALYVTRRSRPLLVAIGGLLLTFVAAAVQQLRIAVHPAYFNHNALYHVIQAVALVMIYAGARYVAGLPPARERDVAA